jgi:peptidoglycan/LPS O-acetylase OafA/YrhL
LVLLVATSSLFWFNRDADWDNWALYFFGSYGLGAAAWWASSRKQMSAWLGVIATIAIAALVLDFRLRIALALAVALVLGFSRRSGLLERWPDAKPLAFLGQISYSVFLVHFPICLIANALFANLGFTSPTAAVFGLFLAWTAALPAARCFIAGSKARSPAAGSPAHSAGCLAKGWNWRARCRDWPACWHVALNTTEPKAGISRPVRPDSGRTQAPPG